MTSRLPRTHRWATRERIHCCILKQTLLICTIDLISCSHSIISYLTLCRCCYFSIRCKRNPLNLPVQLQVYAFPSSRYKPAVWEFIATLCANNWNPALYKLWCLKWTCANSCVEVKVSGKLKFDRTQYIYFIFGYFRNNHFSYWSCK